ncbi:MAG: DUF4422 domain-containing protein [Lachnospiraceae bacterium]|nr:DUF4422 domain-containing protein [Lachnospiraceae bacterium]
MELVIFGAQGYALGAYDAIRNLSPDRKVSSFLVSRMGINSSYLGGIPVSELATFAKRASKNDKDNTEILIATPGDVQPEIEEILENYGFIHHQRLDFTRWTELMKLHHAKLGEFKPLSALIVGCHKPFVRLYMARSDKDRVLRRLPDLPDYMITIHAGAVRGESHIADISDDSGDNISEKNGNYSELTALYWVWKNKLLMAGEGGSEERQYYGLAHYRRFLDIDDDDLLRLVDNAVDAVLPYPMPYEPDISAHHKRYMSDEDWEAVTRALGEIHPEYIEPLSKVLGQRYLYNSNIIMAKKRVLRDYCEWLFPILERTEELSVPKGSEREDRYIGYIGETLETLYFMHNADKLKIAHTGCRFVT